MGGKSQTRVMGERDQENVGGLACARTLSTRQRQTNSIRRGAEITMIFTGRRKKPSTEDGTKHGTKRGTKRGTLTMGPMVPLGPW